MAPTSRESGIGGIEGVRARLPRGFLAAGDCQSIVADVTSWQVAATMQHVLNDRLAQFRILNSTGLRERRNHCVRESIRRRRIERQPLPRSINSRKDLWVLESAFSLHALFYRTQCCACRSKWSCTLGNSARQRLCVQLYQFSKQFSSVENDSHLFVRSINLYQ